MKLSSIYFNRLNSLHDLNLSIIDISDIPVANEVTEKVNGFTIKTGEYEDIDISIKFRHRKRKSILEIQDIIIDWLNDIKDNNLILSFNPNRCYKVKNTVFKEISTSYNTFSVFDVVFECEPFKYIPNEPSVVINNNTNLHYAGNVNGECNIKIYGNGNIQLTINDDTVQINNVNEYVELDSKLLLCLNKDKTSKTIDMIGHFPILTKGINNISWIGNVSKIEILPRTAFK